IRAMIHDAMSLEAAKTEDILVARKQLSVSFIALAIFCCINALASVVYACVRTGQSLSVWPTDRWAPALHVKLNDESALDSTIDGYRQLKRAPNVVLMGSSAMMLPFANVDKAEKLSPPNTVILRYHKSHALENALVQHGIKQPTVYNLSTPLQMPSDSCLFL